MRVLSLSLVLLAALPCACSAPDPAPERAPAKPVAAKPAEPQKETQAMAAVPMRAAGAGAQPAAQPAAQPDPRAERLAALSKEYQEALDAYYKAFDAALGDNKNPTPEDLQKIQETVKEPDVKVYIARAQQLLDEDKTDLTAFKSLQWMMYNDRDPESTKTAVALLEKFHMDRPEMGDMCQFLAQSNRELLEKLLAKSPHVGVRGQACYAMAEGLKNDIQMADYVRSAKPEDLEGMKTWLGADKFAALGTLDVDATQKQIEKIYDRVVAEFSDVKVNVGTKRETTLGKQAGAALYETRNLVVGKPAPEIEGADLDSVAFKLSDYRGKVVLLDFWGNW